MQHGGSPGKHRVRRTLLVVCCNPVEAVQVSEWSEVGRSPPSPAYSPERVNIDRLRRSMLSSIAKPD
jgi:hypothetical protein